MPLLSRLPKNTFATFSPDFSFEMIAFQNQAPELRVLSAITPRIGRPCHALQRVKWGNYFDSFFLQRKLYIFHLPALIPHHTMYHLFICNSHVYREEW